MKKRAHNDGIKGNRITSIR